MPSKKLPVVASPRDLDTEIAQALSKLGLALKQQTWLSASEEGLSPTQGQILASLAMAGAQSGTELKDRLGVSLPTVSDSVKALEGKGLVTRSPDPRHPRAVLIALSARGKRVATKTRSWPDFLSSAAGVMAEDERKAFHAGLLKMLYALQDSGHIPTSGMCFSCVHFRPHAHQGAKPHHCALMDAAIAPHELRADCDEHTRAEPAVSAEAWRAIQSRS